jgi:hypothetical protein
MRRSSGPSTRWLTAIPVRAAALDARGPGLRGPTAIGALAPGATALGAVTIGRLAIARRRSSDWVIDDLEVPRLRVVDRKIVSERRPPSTASGGAPEVTS